MAMRSIDLVLAHRKRRSQRVILDVPLLVRGESEDKRAFEEDALTLIVNAHGALVMLEEKVVLGQKVILTNIKSGDEREGSVRYVGPAYAGVVRVGIQFSRPAPEFWLLSSPPTDWSQF
jgi:hypothetical protein